MVRLILSIDRTFLFCDVVVYFREFLAYFTYVQLNISFCFTDYYPLWATICSSMRRMIDMTGGAPRSLMTLCRRMGRCPRQMRWWWKRGCWLFHCCQEQQVAGLQFCPRHKPAMMLEVCTTYHAALAIVRPEMVKQLFMPMPMLLPDMQAGLMSIRVRQSHQPGHGSSVWRYCSI